MFLATAGLAGTVVIHDYLVFSAATTVIAGTSAGEAIMGYAWNAGVSGGNVKVYLLSSLDTGTAVVWG